ncbi:MAG: amino acid adenylation domain-containing protein, partial [Planctomycetes bacterium]|nr:amino acid adenylation domain-containing protein [Planctomycetota bacterium]
YQELTLTLDSQQSQELKEFSRQHRLTLNTLVQGAWAALLSRYSGESDVVFGVTMSGRQVPVAGIDRMLGLFINTIPLRVKLESNELDHDLLGELQTIQENQQQNNQYAYAALADIQDWSEVPNGISLFDTIIVFENYPVDEKLQDDQNTGSLQLTDLQAIEYTNYPVTLSVMTGEKLHFTLSYDSVCFTQESMERMLDHLRVLLKGMITQPDMSLQQLPLLTQTELEQFLSWNKTETLYPEELTIVDLFEAQVEKTPDNIAVTFEDKQLRYRELNRKANQLANYLLCLRTDVYNGFLITDNCLVGICVERSLEMVIGLLGILKAGGAYVPLDPDYPRERIRLILEDSNVSVLLSQSSLMESLPLTETKVVCLDSERQQIEACSDANPVIQSGPEDLSYVIYTSGTTGVPRGVMIEQRSKLNHLYAIISQTNLTEADIVAQNASPAFDISIWQFLAGLLVGGRVSILSAEAVLDPVMLLEQIVQERITILELVPSLLQAILFRINQQSDVPDLSQLRLIIPTGEALPTNLCERWFEIYPTIPMLNAYGPAECSDDVTCYRIDKKLGVEVADMPIGKPLNNLQIHVLDDKLQEIPVGVTGELYVGGIGVGRGYLNSPQKTSEAFIPNRFSIEPGARLYRTGDSGYYLPDGNLVFLGRIDNQVKLRGFRIELSEIEFTLIRHEVVKEAVVVLYDKEDNPCLSAYITLAMPIDEVAGILRTWLKGRLPEYMVPADFTVLEKLPLTPNGKVDRKAFPEPDTLLTGKYYQAPRETVELQLAQIWENVLDIRPVGISDNFFELGGHSLLAIRLMTQIEQQLKKQLPLTTLFQNTTIEQFATILRKQAEPLPWSSLVAIQPKGEKLPIFCVHPAGGNVFCYLELAQHLGEEQPFYGLQSFGFEAGQVAHTHVVEMARFYLDEVQTLHPHGPYQLAGWSFGGLVAFEMAIQLQTQG